MIIWSGWGILAVLLGVLGALGGSALGLAVTGTGTGQNLGGALGLGSAGVAIWYLGQRLNQPWSGFDERTGQPVQIANRHRLFFVPMQYWGIAAGFGAAVILVAAFS